MPHTPATNAVHDVVIIGSGPAGLTAAIYAARADLAPVVIEGVAAGGPAGGQLTLTTDVENYPGFPAGISGQQLVADMREQAARFGAAYLADDVVRTELDGDVKVVTLDSGVTVRARALIVATGARPRRLEVPGEDAMWGSGVSSCATCDGFFFRDKHVVVVGGGDTAAEEATFLTRFAARVTLVHRGPEMTASKVMAARVAADPKVTCVWNTEITAVKGGAHGVTSVSLHPTAASGRGGQLRCDGMFLAIGHIPNTWLFPALETDAHGYLVVKHQSTETNVDGVFAAGDVADHTYRQAVTAAASGCRAALDAERWLATHS